jgi:hypothetical protein
VDCKLKNESDWFNLKDINRPDFNYLPNDLIIELSNQHCLVNQGITECIKVRQKKMFAEKTSEAAQYCITKKV